MFSQWTLNMCLFTMLLFQRFCSAVFIVNFKQIPRFKLINFEHNCLLGWVKVILKCTGTRRHWYSTIKILMFYIEINSRPNWRLNNKRKIKTTILKVERIKNFEVPTPQNGETYSNNSSVFADELFWVSLTILWGWRK